MKNLPSLRELLPTVRRFLSSRCSAVSSVGLGIGPKRPLQVVWRVYVLPQLLPERTRFEDLIPRTFFGVPIEIFEVDRGYPTAGNQEIPIYTAGIPIESNGSGWNVPSSIGALGCFARHNPTGKTVLLTNSHVMFPGFKVFPSSAIYCPGYSSCCSGGDAIATPVYKTTVPARDLSNDPQHADYYEGYTDGKWYGGFKFKMGQTWFINPATGVWTKTNLTARCSETDCAIAELRPGLRYQNVMKVPGGETISIDGINDEPATVIGPPSGISPAYTEYLRVLSPRDGGKLIYATMLTRFAPDGQLHSQKRVDRHGVEHTVSAIFDIGFPPEDAESVGTKTLIDQFTLLPRPTPPKPQPGQSAEDYRGSYDYSQLYGGKLVQFDHGDSGSVVIDYQNRVVALVTLKEGFVAETMALKADRDLPEFTNIEWVAIATPITTVLEFLDITIPAAGFSGTAPGAGLTVSGITFSADAETISRRRAGARLREELIQSRGGRLLLGKIRQHREEVRRLFATVRSLQAAWRALEGPRFFNHCIQSALHEDHTIPPNINGVTRKRLFEGLFPILVEHASLSLRRDLLRYQDWAASRLLNADNVAAVSIALAQRHKP